MYTRRSWRNQERLWQILGEVKKPIKPKRSKLPTKAEVIAARWAKP